MGMVWIRPEDYQNVGKIRRKVGEVEIELSLSPYDLPREVEGKLDKSTGVFHILFRYLDQEPAVARQIDDEITINVGKNSGKILGFEVQVRKGGIRQIELQTTRAVENEIPRLQRVNQKANFEVVRSVLESRRDSIFSEALTAG